MKKAHFNMNIKKSLCLVNLLKSQHIVSDFFIVLFYLKIHMHTCYYGAIVAFFNNETFSCIFSSFAVQKRLKDIGTKKNYEKFKNKFLKIFHVLVMKMNFVPKIIQVIQIHHFLCAVPFRKFFFLYTLHCWWNIP